MATSMNPELQSIEAKIVFTARDSERPVDETFGSKVVFDADLGYDLNEYLRVSVGGTNILNAFPDEHEKDSNYSNGRFPYSRRVSQFGTNGAFYYGRLQFNL